MDASQGKPTSCSTPASPEPDRLLASDLRKQLGDYRLATAEILYHFPDHPGLLQTYLWQDYDLAPHFPVLRKFLRFWQKNLDGKLHSITVTSRQLIRPSEFRFADSLERVH